MQIAIAKEYIGLTDRDHEEALEWIKACIQKRIDHDHLQDQVDWNDLIVKDERKDEFGRYRMECRLPLKNCFDMKLVWHHNTWPWGKSVDVVKSDGSGIVSMSFEDDNPGVCFLYGLSVIEPNRRRGIAKCLMLACESYCIEHGIFRIELDSVLVDWVQDFYKKCGFVPIVEDGGLMRMYKILK